ncbi:MAG: ribosomal L7Ae/L30e/S12e/Gadd45 family protein [Syntrophomonadales bacterium]
MHSLQHHSHKAVGSRQVKKAILKGSAEKVYIALDAEKHVTRPLIELCQERNLEVEYVESMEQLGKACGIAVGSAAVALLIEHGKEVQD